MINREYISQDYNGDRDRCNKNLESIRRLLHSLIGSQIRGYRFKTISDEEDLLDEGFDEEDKEYVIKKAENILPFLCGVVSFNCNNADADKFQLEQKFGLIRLK